MLALLPHFLKQLVWDSTWHLEYSQLSPDFGCSVNFIHPLLQSSPVLLNPPPSPAPSSSALGDVVSERPDSLPLLCSPLRHPHSPWHWYRGALPTCAQGWERGLQEAAQLQPQGLLDPLPTSAQHIMPPTQGLQEPHPKTFIRERECSFPTRFPNNLTLSLSPHPPVKQELASVRLPVPSGVFTQPSSSHTPAGPWLLSCSDPHWLSQSLGLSHKWAAQVGQPGAWPHHGSPHFPFLSLL